MTLVSGIHELCSWTSIQYNVMLKFETIDIVALVNFRGEIKCVLLHAEANTLHDTISLNDTPMPLCKQLSVDMS